MEKNALPLALTLAVAAALIPGSGLAASMEGPEAGGAGLERAVSPAPASLTPPLPLGALGSPMGASETIPDLAADGAAAKAAGKLEGFHARVEHEAEALSLVPGFEAQALAYRAVLPKERRRALDQRVKRRLHEIAGRLKTEDPDSDSYNGYFSPSHGGIAIWGPGGRPMTPAAARLMTPRPSEVSASKAPEIALWGYGHFFDDMAGGADGGLSEGWAAVKPAARPFEKGELIFTNDLGPARIVETRADGSARVDYLDVRDGSFDSDGVLDAAALARVARTAVSGYGLRLGDRVITAGGAKAVVVGFYGDGHVAVDVRAARIQPGLARVPVSSLARADGTAGAFSVGDHAADARGRKGKIVGVYADGSVALRQAPRTLLQLLQGVDSLKTSPADLVKIPWYRAYF